MPTTIQNPSIEPTTLPFPFYGVLKGRQIIVLNLTIAQVTAALGGTVGVGPLLLAESSSAGPFDTSYLGVADRSPTLRQTVGPFTAPGALGVLAASQTDLDLRYEFAVTAAALGFVAKRAGSIVGLSGHLSAAVTGGGTNATLKVTVNGSEVGAALNCAFTQAGAEVTKFATTTPTSVPFVAGDILGVSYTSTAIGNTPACVSSIEIEC